MNFPNENAKYRSARDKLLKAEIDLRRQIEKVAAERRKLPPGGEVPEDYVFQSEQGSVKLSELFGRGDTLVAPSTFEAISEFDVELSLLASSPTLNDNADITFHAFTAGNSIQKQLPSPYWDSTPTAPCMRSTAFCTIGRPIPVPG